MPPRRHAGGNRPLGASVAGILNSDATNDEEAQRRVVTLFGSLLVILLLVDMVCATAVVWLTCRTNDGNDNDNDSESFSTTSQCVRSSLVHGFMTFHPFADGHSEDMLGDLLAMSITRAVAFVSLLLLGIHYGRSSSSSSSSQETQEETFEQGQRMPHPQCLQVTTDLTEPLLSNGHQEDTTTPPSPRRGQLNGGSNAVNAGSSTTPSTATADNVSSSYGGQWKHRLDCRLTPAQVQTIVMAILFILCTYYQVYAGLKVSTLPPQGSSSSSSTTTMMEEAIVPLLCLTVLWINAEAYVFRTLLMELTREEGLYLPPEVHRHPMYLVTNRSISIHWCDLCHQPMGGSANNGSGRRTNRGGSGGNGNNDNNDNGMSSCYRCALCDFDVCLKCAKRTDAATVGENILRGDRGVRVEEAMTTTGYVRRSMQVAKSELPLLLLSFVLLGATSISRLLLPHFQGRIIDKVIPNPDTGEYDKAGFMKYIKVYIVIMVAQGAVSTFYSAILTLVSRRLKFTLRNSLLEKILIQDVAYFDGTESGRLISRLTNDLDLMMSPIQSSLSSLLSNLLILFGGLVMCFAKSYRLSMISFITIGPISALWENYAHWSKGLAREMLSYWAEGNSIASQALSHVRTVKAFGCEDKVLQKYSDTNQQALYCGVKDAWGNAVTTALTGYLDLGSGVLILYFGGLLVYRGELSVGELVTFQLFWNMMNAAFQNLQGLITSFTRSAAGAEKVFSMWDSHPDIDPQQGSDVDWKVDGHLQMKDVQFYYQMRPDNIVLNKFSLDVPAGKTLALVGRSGGGKSTIINLLLRFYDAREGTIALDGRNYQSLKVNQLRRLFGVVTQETELFALTVEENIAYGLDKNDYTMEDVIAAAKKAFAHDFIVEMKDGYQTRIGERGNRLSGGQRQRLAIARVFLRKPKIILLDEATSALDETSQEAVQQALANLIEESQATVVLVAHRLSTVVNADSICVIDKGSVLEQGNHEELVSKGGIYASMVEKQMRKKADVLDQEKDQGTKGNGLADDIDALLDGK